MQFLMMNRTVFLLILGMCMAFEAQVQAQGKAQNPIIWADVPD
jgi:hypothetical protein